MVNRLVVHAGVFHADDAMCAAMAKAINPHVEIVRTNVPDPKDLDMNGTNGVYVADIGGGKFDHHQKDAAIREDGNKYAACGLLYNEWKDDLFPGNESAQKYFEEVYIKPIELTDNGIRENTLTVAIDSFVPEWDSEKNMDDAFNDACEVLKNCIDGVQSRSYEIEIDAAEIHAARETMDQEWEIAEYAAKASNPLEKDHERYNNAVHDSRDTYVESLYKGEDQTLVSYVISHDLAKSNKEHDIAKITADRIVGNVIENLNSKIRAVDLIKEAYEKAPNKEVVVLDRALPWQNTLCPSEAKFVIYPSIRGGYNLQCVPPIPGSFDRKLDLPITGHEKEYEGCTFAHTAKFLAAFDTLEHAECAAEHVLELEREKTAAREEPDIEQQYREELIAKYGECKIVDMLCENMHHFAERAEEIREAHGETEYTESIRQLCEEAWVKEGFQAREGEIMENVVEREEQREVDHDIDREAGPDIEMPQEEDIERDDEPDLDDDLER